MIQVVAVTIQRRDLTSIGIPPQFATRDGMQRVCDTLATTAAKAVAIGQNPQVVEDALFVLRGGNVSLSSVADKTQERNTIVDAFKTALKALIS